MEIPSAACCCFCCCCCCCSTKLDLFGCRSTAEWRAHLIKLLEMWVWEKWHRAAGNIQISCGKKSSGEMVTPIFFTSLIASTLAVRPARINVYFSCIRRGVLVANLAYKNRKCSRVCSSSQEQSVVWHFLNTDSWWLWVTSATLCPRSICLPHLSDGDVSAKSRRFQQS